MAKLILPIKTRIVLILTSYICYDCIIGVHGEARAIDGVYLFYMNPKPNGQPRESPLLSSSKNFTFNSPDIKVIIHGWLTNHNDPLLGSMLHAYLAKGHDAILMADWGELSFVPYKQAKNITPKVGLALAYILEAFFRQNSIELEKLHIIGHSLGAHIAGAIGNYFNGSVGRITGLDPAGLQFENLSDGLRPKHAKFVDCIHTDIPMAGQLLQRGHVDFYPNYGTVRQPGCEIWDWLKATECSHLRSISYYVESIQNAQSFPAIPCPIRNVSRKSCELHHAKGMAFMGEHVAKAIRGSYYLRTHSETPYGKGKFSRFYE